ncbi:ABC transporter ATP-binding protein [Corynebacterium aquatimens]|uniref:ATP-binding cassette domain-containing protein n=1 Tax=Corynebacterium TaxID=1716 RepID=UPI001F1E1EBC|nr:MULTISPECIES: ABC transporter ATP-binding protein [Corynebacterium]QYH19070.1 ABC transporter ATP-binding protein [Corynebacterium aquatimens]UIZ92077.1 ABC transporter ATP-binding protein [Corynebacterium sp. CNCTC7651]
MNQIISTGGLQRSFGKKAVLAGVDLDLAPGGIHGLLGRNGVGKSTLLNILAGQLKPSAGEVRVFGEAPFDNAATMDRTALTGVDTAYPGSWTLRNILAAAAMRYPRWDQAFADQLAADFTLDGAMGTRYGSLSRGQRAMAAIIIGLASGAELTLLDEPYVGLDTHNTQVFYRHLLGLNDSGRTVIMATHHIEDAAKILDTALILGRDGRIARHIAAEDADNFAVASGSFPEFEGALAYRRSPAGAHALIPAALAEGPSSTRDNALGGAARVRPAGLDDLIEAYLEVS